MIKAGMSNNKTNNMTDYAYLGEGSGFQPQLELARYMAMIGLQKKGQADDLYGGNKNAAKYGYGMFGINPLQSALQASQEPPQKAKAPDPEDPVTPATPPPPPGNPPPPGGQSPPVGGGPPAAPPPAPPPYGGPPPAGGPPGNPPAPPPSGGGGRRAPMPDGMTGEAATAEALLEQWANSMRGQR